MTYDPPLIPARLLRRYKRFLADVETESGMLTVHTPNTGSMLGVSEPGSRVWLRDSNNPKRKYRYSWELTETPGGVLVGVNTGLSNTLVAEAIASGVLEPLAGYGRIRREVAYGAERSRIDLLLEEHARLPDCYVEVKNVTLAEAGLARFPDAVSSRGTRHLRELMHMVEQGFRAAMCYCIQRSDVTAFAPAADIDPLYAATLGEAVAAGVEVHAWRADMDIRGIRLVEAVPVVI